MSWDGSIPIITHSRNSTVSTWCCGMPEISKDGNSLVCPNSESAFELDVGSIIVGRAALANATISSSSGSSDTSATSTLSSSSSSSGSSSSKETAIGVGVGVPLGVVALASLAWAIWERKNRLAISKKLDNEKQYLMQGRYVDGTGNNANAIPKAQPQPMPELEAHVVSEMDSRPKPSAE
ncbi:MAG: hypothetical protein M1834_002961 [Cirrosporium novae-zelandiae]|nr:MAG: hypothetical protein M1834_002961 [Cirrosporium novae-zelandiae]